MNRTGGSTTIRRTGNSEWDKSTPRVKHTTYNDISDSTLYDQQQLELDREWFW